MSKKSKKKPVRKTAPATSTPLKPDKRSIIVLAFAAVLLAAMYIWIYSEDIFHGNEDIFSPYGDEIVEFEKATIVDILSEDIEIEEVANNAYKGTQELSVIVKSYIIHIPISSHPLVFIVHTYMTTSEVIIFYEFQNFFNFD